MKRRISMKPNMTTRHRSNRLIMGRNCVQELFKEDPRRILEVYVQGGEGTLAPFLRELEQARIPLYSVGKEELKKMVQSDSHQGIVAAVKEPKYTDIDAFLRKTEDNEKTVLLMIDSIYDPQNFGALLRAAECFGVDAVIWSKNRGSDLTAVVSKASVGASELMWLIKVSNLADAMRKFQQEGYTAITAEIGEGAKKLDEMNFPDKVLLVVGSEGEGVQKLLSKQADAKVYIPMRGKIDSLNVSQATAVILSSICK